MSEYYISSGVVSSGINLDKGDKMTVYAGGTMNDTIVYAAELNVEGAANDVELGMAAYCNVSSGGTVNSVNVNYGGQLNVSNGGIANNVVTNYNVIISEGGIVSNSILSSGLGMINILSGGIHKGTMEIADGAKVFAEEGSTIDLSIVGRTAADDYIISDLSAIQGAPSFTITVGDDQAAGEYKLALSSTAFNGSFSIGTGSIGIGDSLEYNGMTYSLAQNDGAISLSAVVIAPSAAVSGITWRNINDGTVAVWNFTDGVVSSQDFPGTVDVSYWSVAGVGDFDGNGKDDILWRGASGEVLAWGDQSGANALTLGSAGNEWVVETIGDFDGDGEDDVLFRLRSGEGNLAIWGGGNGNACTFPGTITATYWDVAGAGDFNGDGKDDILWRGASGETCYWGAGAYENQVNLSGVGAEWVVEAVGDFDGNGKDDILFRLRSGEGNLAIWKDGDSSQQYFPGTITATYWDVIGTGDFNGDGQDDILWRGASGETCYWGAGAYENQVNLSGVGAEWKAYLA